MNPRFYITLFLSLPFLLWAKPERLSVIIDNNYPPYSFIDNAKELKGICIDLWREWEKRTGIRVSITGTNWHEALTRMENGEFDVIDTIFYTEERSKKYDFSKPYTKIDVVIFFDSTISGLSDVNSLKGLMVGVKRGDADIDFLKKNGIDYLKEYESYEDIILAAKDNKIKIFVIDKPPGIFYLLKHNIEERFKFSNPLYSGEFHRAVRKGDRDLLNIIESGFEKIPEDIYKDVNDKWLGRSITRSSYTKILKILLTIISIFAFLLLITYLWIISLRKGVKERTIQLKIEKEKAENFTRELLKNEKRFLNLYNNISDIIFSIRPDGTFIDMNPKGLDIIGYTADELQNLNFEKLLVPEEIDKAKKALQLRLSGFEDVLEFKVKTKRGEILTIETKGIVLYEDGKPYAIQVIARDITQQRIREERLMESQKLESLGLLAGGIAHEFNNIMMGIINYIEFIKKDYGNKDLFLSDIENLKNAANRAARLVQQLLGFSRRQMILPQLLNINDLITNFYNSIFKFLGENIKTTLSLSEKNPIIFADKSQIEQIILNIVLNSKDAMPKGGEISIFTDVVHLENEIEGNRSYSGDFALISIKDTGCGIDAKILKQVFEPFFTTKPVGKGTGLGLSMVYGAMQQNNGFVRIESKVNAGTEVKLYFPLSDKGCVDSLHNTLHSNNTSKTYDNFISILLVEDDPEVRSVIKQILISKNINVIEAGNYSEAIKEYENNSDLIKLIICDIVMSDKSGIELRNKIMEKYSDVKFLFITGYSEDVLKGKGIEIKGIEILYKPFNGERLLSAIKMILANNHNPL